jgi:putative component of membrane protein insertase Oxa1/YidC/SpoIIIJ protein YidD
LQNEEYCVIETPAADRPTCAMYRAAYVIEKGELIGTWDIAARDRVLSL